MRWIPYGPQAMLVYFADEIGEVVLVAVARRERTGGWVEGGADDRGAGDEAAGA